MRQFDTLGLVAWAAIVALIFWVALQVVLAFIEIESSAIRERLGGVFSLGDRVVDVHP